VGAAGILGYSIVDLRALALARVLMAAGGAAIIPAAMAMVRNRIAPERRARWFGYFGACMGLAAAIGPLVGGELTQAFGWRSLFAAVLPVVLISLSTLPFFGRDTRPANAPPPARFDLVGSVLLGVGLAAVIIALRLGERGLWLAVSGGATFNREYFDSWRREDIDPILAGGLGFYRNFADVGLYGDELVNMRAKTGAAPRIRGDISRNERMTWIVLTLGGTPMLLLLLGFMRGAYRAKLRDEYRLKLEQNEAA
jgi:MFS family permease